MAQCSCPLRGVAPSPGRTEAASSLGPRVGSPASTCRNTCRSPWSLRTHHKRQVAGGLRTKNFSPRASSPLHAITSEAATAAAALSSGPEQLTRRQAALQSTLAAALLALCGPSHAIAETATASPNFTLFEEAQDKYSLLVPAAWEMGEGKAGTRRVLAFYPPGSPAANVNVVVTTLGGDFTGLGSFGTAYDFGENLVNGLDRSWKRPPGQAAKLLDTKSKNGFYYIEYTLEPVGKPKVHFLTVVGTAHNTWVNRLYTVTGQFLEDTSTEFREPIQKAISSFKFTG